MLRKLAIENFRCIESAALELDTDLTWILGNNASGKTSLLEAFYFLGNGRSFRTHKTDQLIRENADRFQLVATLQDIDGRDVVLGLARQNQQTQGRLAGEDLKSLADAANAFPVVILDTEINRLISEGPGERRRWLDWGVFHVEQHYQDAWKRFRRLLQQRNSALKEGRATREINTWSGELVEAVERVHQLRLKHLESLLPAAQALAEEALGVEGIIIQYHRGWPEGESYEEALDRHLPRDREQGLTRSGPQRADISIRIDGSLAQVRVSRGQLKMLAGALWLAQIQVVRTHGRQKRSTLLVDDLAAELDEQHLKRFIHLLKQQDCQLVLTAIHASDIARTGLEEGKVFHVEHGKLAVFSRQPSG